MVGQLPACLLLLARPLPSRIHTRHLENQLTEAQSRADRLGRECEAGNERLRDLERAKDALAAELLSVRERTRSEHEERLEAEVGRLREQSAKELADIRNSGREIFERENNALRESRQDALQVPPRGCDGWSLRFSLRMFFFCFFVCVFCVMVIMCLVYFSGGCFALLRMFRFCGSLIARFVCFVVLLAVLMFCC